jgi:hypothetical protein
MSSHIEKTFYSYDLWQLGSSPFGFLFNYWSSMKYWILSIAFRTDDINHVNFRMFVGLSPPKLLCLKIVEAALPNPSMSISAWLSDLKPHCIQSSRVLVPAGTSKSTSQHPGRNLGHGVRCWCSDTVTLSSTMRTGGFELGSSALTSSTLKWLHRIKCGFKGAECYSDHFPHKPQISFW